MAIHAPTPLLDAVAQGDIERAVALCQAGADPNALRDDWNALLLAVTRENPAMVEALLPFCDPDIRDAAWDSSALSIACDAANMPAMARIAQILIPVSNLSLADRRGYNPIDRLAVSGASPQSLERLLDLCAQRDLPLLEKARDDWDADSPLFSSIAQRCALRARALAEAQTLSESCARAGVGKAPRI